MYSKKWIKVSSTLLFSQLLLSAPAQILAVEQNFNRENQPTIVKRMVNEIPETSVEGTSDSSNLSDGEQTPEKPTTSDSSIENVPTTDSTTNLPADSSQEMGKNEGTTSSEDQSTSESTESTNTSDSTQHTMEQMPNNATKPVQKKPTVPHAEQSKPIQSSEPVRSLTSDQEATIHFEKDESVETFIRKIGESARKIGQENDLYASVMIAQAILESGSGQSKLAQAPCYNLFGIKGSYKHKSTCLNTQEEGKDGRYYTIQAAFRVYDNYEESLADYAKLLKDGLTGDRHFYEGAWKSKTKTYQEATKFLTGRYATDSKYNQKLDSLIETYDLTKYDEKENVKLNPDGFMVPVKNYSISSHFGPRSNEFHRGLDLAAAQGEPILAAKKGKVIIAEFHPSWGNYVVLEHKDGTTTLYAHQQEYQVKVGQQVKQGQTIGYVGSTGNSTGSHLHFEVCSDASLAQLKLIKPETVLFK